MGLDVQMNKSSNPNFELVFPKLPTESTFRSNEELTLNIYQTIIPGINLDTTPFAWMGMNTNKATGPLTFEPWNVNFVVDSEFKNWQLLFNWFTYINNNKDKPIEYHENYSVDATLRITNNFRQEVLRIHFVSIWISLLGEVSLSYREGEQLLEGQASFVYDRFETRT